MRILCALFLQLCIIASSLNARPSYAKKDEAYIVAIINKSSLPVYVQNTDVGTELEHDHRANKITRTKDDGSIQTISYKQQEFVVNPGELVKTDEFIVPWQDVRFAEVKRFPLIHLIAYYGYATQIKYAQMFYNRKALPTNLYGGTINIVIKDGSTIVNKATIQQRHVENKNGIYLNATNNHQVYIREPVFETGLDYVISITPENDIMLEPYLPLPPTEKS